MNNNLLGKHFQKLMRQHSENMERIIEPLLKLQNYPGLNEWQKSLDGFSKLTEDIALKNQEAFKRIADLNKFSGIADFSEQFELLANQLQLNLKIDHLISPHLSRLLTDINYQINSNKNFADHIENNIIPRIYEDLESEAKEIKIGYSSRQSLYFKLNMLMFVLTVLLSLWLSKSSKQIQDNIQEDQKKTHNLIDALSAKTDSLIEEIQSDSSILLLANKSAPLRKAPNSNSDTLTTVFEGQYLDLIDEIKRWYKVQFFNYEVDSLGTGWVYKGHVDEIREKE